MKLSEILDCSAGYLIYEDITRNDIETEIKIQLVEKDFHRLEFITEKESDFLNENHQVDTYYQPTYRPFIDKEIINEWLRIGKRGNKIILNYKNWYDIHCDEYEVEIDNEENLRKIFRILDLEKIAIVDKTRKNYRYLDKYEISLDIVKDLGYFIEIEVKKYDKSILEEYNDLLLLAKQLKLDLNKIDRRGYPYYLLDKNKKKKSTK